MFVNSKVTRRISLLIIASYLSLVTQSVQAAIQQEVFARPKPNTDHSTPVNQLEQMHELWQPCSFAVKSVARFVCFLAGFGAFDYLNALF